MTYSPVGGVVSTLNATTTPLAGGATFTGTWELCTNYAAASIKSYSNVAGTLYVDFSRDGSTTLDSVQLSDGTSGTIGLRDIIIGSQYFRLRYINGPGAQSSFTLTCLFYRGAKAAIPTTRLGAALGQYTDALTVRLANDPALDTSRGTIGGRSTVNKFGANPDVTASTTEAVTFMGTINFLQAATTVRIKAGGNVNDTAAGTGARSITVVGLDSNFAEASAVIATNGASASSATATSFWRIFRAYVTDSGTYAGVGAGANAGNITVENSAGGTDIITIEAGQGQTQYSGYTVPAGKTAYLTNYYIAVDTAKAATLALYQRLEADDVATPFRGKRLVARVIGLVGSTFRQYDAYPSFPAKTDLWWEVSTGSGAAAACVVSYDLILVDV